MKLFFKSVDPVKFKTPALILFLFEDGPADLSDRPELSGFQGLIGPRLENDDFRAKHLSALTLFSDEVKGPARIILIGLGKVKDYTPIRLKDAAARGLQRAKALYLNSAAMLLPEERFSDAPKEEFLEAAALGARLSQYTFEELKTKSVKDLPPLKEINLIQPEMGRSVKAKKAVETARITAQAIMMARDLVNRPPNLLYPETLAKAAENLAKEVGLKYKILDEAAAKRAKMGSFLGVSQGSDRPGRVIILEHKGGPAKEEPIVLVGKAITFDSGGLCLKPPDGMLTMKTDMSGGGAVLAVLGAAAQMGLKLNLIGVVPAAENMPSGKAYRPGDVLTSMSGKTVEVINTDAEGRMILADGLTLANAYKPKLIIDMATLTGACVVALGQKCAGLFSTDPDLTEALKQASARTGEKIWELPLLDDYNEELKSEAADFKHTGKTRYGGAITAALFLKRFAGKTPWAHIDIAGPARSDKPTPTAPAGGPGFGVTLVLNYLRNV